MIAGVHWEDLPGGTTAAGRRKPGQLQPGGGVGRFGFDSTGPGSWPRSWPVTVSGSSAYGETASPTPVQAPVPAKRAGEKAG